MKWQAPPVIKIYEALGAVGDKRIELNGNEVKVYSSSGNKYYDVRYDPEKNAITANDNGSYWKGYLGYPMIAFLMINGQIDYPKEYTEALTGFAWKDINTKFKNDFDKTEEYIRSAIEQKGINLAELDQWLAQAMRQIEELKLNKLPSITKPPSAY